MVSNNRQKTFVTGRYITLLRWLLVMPCVLWAQADPPQAETSKIMQLADGAADALPSAKKTEDIIAEANSPTRRARLRYLEAYPDQPELEKAQADYQKLLVRRDLANLLQTIQGGLTTEYWLKISRPSDLSMESGIPPAAAQSFAAWIQDIRSRLGLKENERLAPTAFGSVRAAVIASEPAYRVFSQKRTVEDLRAAGKIPTIEKIGAAISDALRREGRAYENPSPREVLEGLKESIRVFGEQKVLLQTTVLLDTKLPIAAPREFGTWEDRLRTQALMNAWASGSPKAFLIGQLRISPDYERFGYWEDAEARYNYLVASLGEEAVLKAAMRLRDAPKTQFLGSEGVNRSMLVDPTSLGCTSPEPIDCIYQMFPTVERLGK